MTFLDRLYPAEGLRVLVTAGASGIGAAIAAAFAETGAAIHICDVDDTALAVFKGKFPECEATHADVADEAQVAAMFETQGVRFGGLDVLVNCAGIAGPTAGVDAIPEREWMRVMDINLNGQYRCLHHGVPMLRESKEANIICISSIAGRMGIGWRTPYVATKWAVVGIAKSLAIELGADNIRVNAVLPGIVEGPVGQSVDLTWYRNRVARVHQHRIAWQDRLQGARADEGAHGALELAGHVIEWHR